MYQLDVFKPNLLQFKAQKKIWQGKFLVHVVESLEMFRRIKVRVGIATYRLSY